MRLLFGCSQLLASGFHLEGTVVDQPERPDSRNGKGDSVRPLCRDLGIRWITAAVVEDQEENDQYDLIEELTPTLHKESTSDLSATVQSVFFSRDLARSYSIFHSGCSSHGVFSPHANTVEEE